MRRSITVLFLSISIAVNATTYYVATTGNDNNPGTITKPWSTWQKGFNSISAGDILYIRGGTYTPAGIVIADVFAAVGVNGKNGTSGSQYQVYAYPGEIPVLDCSTLTNNSYVRIGIMLTNSSYWHLMGLEIKNCNQVTASSPHYGGQGVYITGSSNIIIENCAAHNNQGPGMGTRDVNELTFLNCDSHDNYDPYSDTPGDNADGFDIGFNKNNGIVRCTGCRSWNNSDDGFDMYQDSGYSGIYYLTNCWSWHQGYRSDGVTTGGDGNGFKYGADLQSYDGVTKRYSYNCIAYANRCRGFSQESANVKMVIYNSVAYLNELEGYSFVTYNLADILKNNISYSNGSANVFQSNQTRSNNSWQGGLVVSAADFASIDGTELELPRKADGSLPDMNFLHLVTGSDLIDAGIDVGIPFSGKGPDLGPFETQSGSTNPIPAFTSAAVENATPSLLEMTYNMTLANIIPATSAFSVLVNSVVRTVNTVVISGTKVQLTLASPIVYGDVVTVAYTKPTGNPLQTASGGQAVSISAQAVNNRVNSVNPVYVSSSVENATPSILGITYNMTLSSIVPAASAFSVLVNSIARTVNSVSISGSNVLLTLASAIKFGDIITVSYKKPANNSLQTVSGGQAASFIANSVTNNCQDANKSNDPPVIVIKNESNAFSGFVGEIDASGTYDLNNEILTYTWTVPNKVSVSSTSTPKIKFLSPAVNTSQIITFQLKVTDGKVIVSKSIPINIMPYKPELTVAKITNIDASNFQSPDYPNNIVDGNTATKWSSNGDNQWLLLKLAEPFNISHVELAFLQGQQYESYFDIYASKDNIIWEPVLTKEVSCNFSGDRQVFDFPSTNTDTEYSYIKYIGQGNSLNTWNIISEFKIIGTSQQNLGSGNTNKKNISIYPNPASDFLNISIEEPTMDRDKVMITDLSGKIVFEDVLNPDTKNAKIPISLKSGVYLLKLVVGNLILFSQKLIVMN